MTGHLYYYAKAYYAALAAGFLYLATVIGPDITVADLAHVSLLHWIGFIGSILGVGAGTAAITNGTKAAPQNTDGSYTITNLPAASDLAPATVFPKAAADAAVAAEPAPAPAGLDAPIAPATTPIA